MRRALIVLAAVVIPTMAADSCKVVAASSVDYETPTQKLIKEIERLRIAVDKLEKEHRCSREHAQYESAQRQGMYYSLPAECFL